MRRATRNAQQFERGFTSLLRKVPTLRLGRNGAPRPFMPLMKLRRSRRGATGFTPLLQDTPVFKLGRNVRLNVLSWKKPPSSRWGVTGFTLIEVLVAIALFAIGMLALAALFTAEGVGTDFARQQSAATMLAQQQLELLMQKAYDDPVDLKVGQPDCATGFHCNKVNEQGIVVQPGQTEFTRLWWVVDSAASPERGCIRANADCTACAEADGNMKIKAVCVTVSWLGRQEGETHTVSMRMNKGDIDVL